MSIVFCLDCEHEIVLKPHQIKVGQRVACPNCRAKLEIINVAPPELDWVYDGPVADLHLFDNWDDETLPTHRK